ncbi:exosortase F system-associated membrane protein [Flavobacterium channae]|uniref:exosortase F system-associated membrane protein n=1 Tax=Flavobacterium channae TaxID=2897181 RepID=UPI001E657EFD|nr:exosortase F system-associated protein [Flavobacterium channae]UGS23181.1 exosortase F system-associated protein [Flavobacterium channae]
MLKKLLKDRKSIFFIVLALVGLILIRAFEDDLFYDPFLAFFKTDYQNKPLPDLNQSLLFLNLFLRYLLNTVFSLMMIKFLFNEKQLVAFSGYLFLVLFVVLITIFFGLLHFSNQPDYLILFYIRRFLIQPLFLVLFIPAFYYQKLSR